MYVMEPTTGNICQYNLCVYGTRGVDSSMDKTTHFSYLKGQKIEDMSEDQ
jgi:hypothetical protein